MRGPLDRTPTPAIAGFSLHGKYTTHVRPSSVTGVTSVRRVSGSPSRRRAPRDRAEHVLDAQPDDELVLVVRRREALMTTMARVSVQRSARRQELFVCLP